LGMFIHDFTSNAYDLMKHTLSPATNYNISNISLFIRFYV